MKFRFLWIACFLIASLAQARASTATVVTFEPANRCAPANDTWLALPACSASAGFDALSFSWNASTSGGPALVSTVDILKVVDSSSAPLLMKMLAGQSIPHVRISIYNTDATVPANTINPLYELYLSDVYVTQVSTDAAGGGPGVQEISLTYGSISTRVVTLNPDGTIASTTILGYDQRTGTTF